ncbi:hypothetical protein DXG03_003749 [Asterophora parasitica]|uniref:DUF6593 domain-containing protein n=1 Tax=Asterophora parasitica TaxID=117018 RepID=A0A9P7G3B8_9AGAR|nr:hypothetical protein DXG03_003749 [Asterophora parasitica]
MHLYLSTRHHLNSIYSNEEGQALYKVETPSGIASRTSSISYVVPNEGGDKSMVDRYAHLAQVDHNAVASSVLRFGGIQYETKDYFRKEGWGAQGRNRIFTGPDGREYKWVLQSYDCNLFTNDDAKTPIAAYHQKTYGFFSKAHPASLEIFPGGEHMIKEILITFVYIEKIRKDKERGAQAATF